MMITPSRDSAAHCSSVLVASGVSRMQRTSLYRSFRATCAVRLISVSPIPEAILPTVDVEQGNMTYASNLLEPEAIGAVRSSFENCFLQNGSKSFSFMPASSFNNVLPHLLRTTNLSPGHCFRNSTA